MSAGLRVVSGKVGGFTAHVDEKTSAVLFFGTLHEENYTLGVYFHNQRRQPFVVIFYPIFANCRSVRMKVAS